VAAGDALVAVANMAFHHTLELFLGVGSLISRSFVELIAQFVVVNFVARAEIRFGIGEKFVGTNAAEKVFTDAFVVPLDAPVLVARRQVSVSSHQLVQHRRHCVRHVRNL